MGNIGKKATVISFLVAGLIQLFLFSPISLMFFGIWRSIGKPIDETGFVLLGNVLFFLFLFGLILLCTKLVQKIWDEF